MDVMTNLPDGTLAPTGMSAVRNNSLGWPWEPSTHKQAKSGTPGATGVSSIQISISIPAPNSQMPLIAIWSARWVWCGEAKLSDALVNFLANSATVLEPIKKSFGTRRVHSVLEPTLLWDSNHSLGSNTMDVSSTHSTISSPSGWPTKKKATDAASNVENSGYLASTTSTTAALLRSRLPKDVMASSGLLVLSAMVSTLVNVKLLSTVTWT